MELIGITPPDPAETPEAEAARATVALDAGLSALHLRKPEATADELEAVLRRVPSRLYGRIVLHDHFRLARTFGLRGIHLNRRNPAPLPDFPGRIGRSCHSLEELREADAYDYLFLSPVYDSFSKSGYRSSFTSETLQKAQSAGLIGNWVIALGGITPERIGETAAFGFGGVAVLGYLWSESGPEGIRRNVERLLQAIEKATQ